MKIHLVSDLHLEFAPYTCGFPKGTDVVVAAGDIAKGPKGPFFLREIYGDYVPIVYISGNHEHYGHEYQANMQAIRDCAEQFNVHFLDNEAVDIDGVTFVGGMLWTDFCLHGQANQYPSMKTAQKSINDFRIIRNYDKTLSPSDTLKWHHECVKMFGYQLDLAKQVKKNKTVVVSHMAPSAKSIHAAYAGDSVNPYYASDLSKFIDTHNPDLWVHGHMHNSFDYEVYNTRVVCNPRGYVHGRDLANPENKEFNPELLIDI